MEAATLTLEEAGSVLEAAYGPDHPELGVLRHRISAMHGAARDGNGMPVSFAAAPEMPRKQLNSARGGSAGAFGAALPAPTPRGQSSSAEGRLPPAWPPPRRRRQQVWYHRSRCRLGRRRRRQRLYFLLMWC